MSGVYENVFQTTKNDSQDGIIDVQSINKPENPFQNYDLAVQIVINQRS